MNPSISIITATFNSTATIADCLNSVNSQSYPHIEHIIIDGGSTDETLEIISLFTSNNSRLTKVVSEPDKGIYDALNKGFAMASGDIIGILHSDDIFADENVVSRVVSAMTEQKVDSCYADISIKRRVN